MAIALISLLTGRVVRSDVGMTGEITLRGQVMPVGGIKEKVLAAHRVGLKTVILPRQNEQDIEQVPDEVKKAVRFIFVDTVQEVIKYALGRAKRSTRKTGTHTQPEGTGDASDE
jgi:ATP-dependent Lon protease